MLCYHPCDPSYAKMYKILFITHMIASHQTEVSNSLNQCSAFAVTEKLLYKNHLSEWSSMRGGLSQEVT